MVCLWSLLFSVSVFAEEEIHFSDNFESATLGNSPPNSDGWTIAGAGGWYTANATTVNTQNNTQGGSKSMYSSGGNAGQGIGDWNAPGFGGAGAITNGRAEIWFYDDMAATKRQYICADNNTGNQWAGIVIRNATSATKYCYTSQLIATTFSSIDRTLGWHKVEWIRDNVNTTLYLDGVSIYVMANASFANFNDFDCGSFSWDNVNGNTGLWVDDAKVVRGQNQSRYRWYQNDNAENPTALAAENTAITNVANGTTLRLRLQAQNDMSYAWVGAYVALRYREGTTGTWTDLGTSAHWSYADGMGGNGDQVGFTRLTNSNIREHFAENVPSAGILSVPSTQYAEWDFSLTPVWTNVSKGAVYYFKLVLVDGSGNYLSDLVSYPYLPQATTATGKTWVGGSGGAANRRRWAYAANWSPSGIPVTGDEVVIPDVTYDPVLDMNAAGANSIASLTIAAGGVLNLNNGTAYTLQIDGSFSVSGTVTHTTATVNILGTGVTIGGAYNHTGAGDFNAANATMTVNQGVTYTMSGAAGNVTVQGLVVNGLFLQQTNDNTLTATDITINNGGEFRNTRVTTASLVNISGDFTNNGTMSNSTGGNFTFSGAASVIEGSSTTTRFYRFTLQSGQTTLNGTGAPAFTALAGGAVLTAGVLDAAGQRMDVAGGSWTNNGATLTGAGSTVQFTLGNGVNIDNGTTQTTFQNVTIAKTAGQNLTASQALNIDGNVTIATGNFVPGNFTHNVAGNWSDAGGGFVPAAGTIVLEGVSPSITTLASNYFYNLTVSTSGTASMGASELDVNGVLTVSAGATLNCGSSTANDVTGTASISGTLDMGAGTTIMRGAVTVNSGGTLKLATTTGAPTVQLGNGAVAGSITVNSGGTLTASGYPKPFITRQGTANYGLTIASGATISVDGLTLSYLNANGLAIANGATITKIDNCAFSLGTKYLSVGANSGSYVFYFCDFDGTANPNVTAPNGATIVMNNAAGARGAEPNGEANDGTIDGNITWVYGKRWDGSASTAWNNVNNWTPVGVPVSTDSVVILSGMPNQPQLNMNATGANRISTLMLVGGATLNLNNGTTYTLQIDGNAIFNGAVTHTTAAVNIDGTSVILGGTYTHSGAGDFTAANATMTINSGGTYIMSGAAGDVTVQALTISGLFRQETNNNTLAVTNLTINSDGEFRNTRVNIASLINISGIFTNNGSMSANTGGNFTFLGATCILSGTSSSTNFYRFTLQSGQTTINATGSPALTVIGGGVVLTAGELNAAGKTIALQTSGWTNNGALFSGSGSTVKFTGATAATIDNGASQTSFQNVEVAKNAGVSLTASRALDINGNFILSSGTFAPGNFTHTVAGDWNDAGGSFAPALGTVALDGASPAIVTAAINNFYNLTVSTSGTASLGAYELDVDGNLTVSTGSTLDCGTGTANDVTGTASISGTLDLNTATVTLRGAVTVTSGGTLKLQTASSAPQLRLGNGAVAGSITVQSGGTLFSSGSPRPIITRQGTANYALAVSSGGTINVDGLNIDYPGANGLDIANGAAITKIDNCYFSNGTKYLSVGAASGSYLFYFCSFDGTANPNVTAPNGATITMVNALGTRGVVATSETWDGPVDGNITWSYDKIWTGGAGTTDWATAGNWSPVGEPTSTDDILIPDQTFDPAIPGAGGSCRRITITNGTLSLGTNTLSVYGDFIIQSTGTLIAGTGRVTMTGASDRQINAQGKTFYNLTITNNRTDTLNSTITVSSALTVDAGSGLIVASGKNLTLTAGLTLNGTLDLKNNTILYTGGAISAAVGSTFKVSGTSQLAGGYAMVQNTGSGNYGMTLAGNVEINCARVYNLSNAGLTLSGTGGTGRTFTNTYFYSGQSSAICYLHVTNSGWNGYLFTGLAFQDLGSGTKSVEINTVPGDIVTMSDYTTGTGWVSGDASEIETSGSINWGVSSLAPVWSRNSIGTVKGGSIGGPVFVGTDKSGQELIGLNPATGSTNWIYDASAYGACGTPTYIYGSNSKYKIVASAGNYVIGRQDEGIIPSTQLFPPQALASPGNPYASPDDATFYVAYTGNITKKSMTTGANIAGWPQALADVSRTADPVVFNDEIYVATTGGMVWKYDEDGTPLSSFNAGAGVLQPLLVQGSALYVTPNSANLYAVNASTMTAKWGSPVSLAAASTGPAFCASGSQDIYVAAGTSIQKVTDNGATGSVTWTYGAGNNVESGPIEYNGVVYFGRYDGRYYAIQDLGSSASLITDWPYTNASGNSNTGPWIDVGNTLVIFGTTSQNLDAFTLE
ncbi:MAG: hypothetical protein A2268_01620 [Candidatus Raymondbacteria bacterium RifOxyA12_full_50_37]|nr:MAG: hypothetical protein A2268_01620 [Candidatus Raymondbacteria bacterium RifOxyA12_full_50_37]OGJ87764.1 MAG: hypothetical protein A2248_07225 [Candidatus Raymondbacteria bacterium RIFOXYA2_FULL_49_16]OGJ95642.1 MAG: hypothetical protein A2453_13220 [Candidatus Raymondbacteria bacterium RIFOXYC2_FULL_50_21]OGP43176.1 MAG: hypothetical protein A2324_19045 [Candidatus Raymondbacteria bacterium RIFOXYB2_FULL_49_35]